VPRRNLTHYAAPAAFLLAVTIAVLLIRSAMTSGETAGPTTTLPPPPVRKTVATTTTKKRPTKPAAPRIYTVVAGDTFEVISSKTGVPVARIANLNPNADSNALFIGQKLRLR